jgi:peptidyl-prolyl cis-trans isomerase SurA
MKKKLAAPFLALLALVALLAPVAVLEAQALMPHDPLDKVIAVVEDDVILKSELDRALTNIMSQYQGRNTQLPPREILERQVLERLVMIRLQIARAAGTGIRISDAEVDQAIANMAKQNNLDVAQLRVTLARDGYGYDEFRNTMRDELTVQRLRQRFVQSRVQVTDTEIDLLLQGGGLKRGEVRLAHILIGVPDGAKPEQLAAAREKADKVHKEIEGGLDFSAAAIRYSEGQQALEGGDLGWRRFDEVPSLFAEVISSMKAGDVTQPMRGPSGFHMLKLVDVRENAKQVVSEYHARHIMVKTSEIVSSEEALNSVKNLERRIRGGEDFEKLAKQFSEDKTSGTLGGDMGWFAKGAYGSKVESMIDTLKDGELSEPFQTEVGWHIMQRLGVHEVDKTAEFEREQARDAIRNRKAEEEYDNFLRQMRSEAYVENRLTGKATTG